VALPGYAREADVERARNSGFDAHVAKPMTPEHPLDVIQVVVARRSPSA
jgi:CheY-like chemotaxis protein